MISSKSKPILSYAKVKISKYSGIGFLEKGNMHLEEFIKKTTDGFGNVIW